MTENRTAWSVYANALELLSTTIMVSVLLTFLGVITAGAMFDGEPFALAVGSLLGGFAWPLMFSLRAGQIRKFLTQG